MKRLLLGLAALLVPSAECGAGDFVTIKIDLNTFSVDMQTKINPKGPKGQPVMGGQPPMNTGPSQPPVWAYATIPLKKKIEAKGPYGLLEHHWGKTYVPGAQLLPKDALDLTLREPLSINKQYAERVKLSLKESKGKDRLHLLVLAEWALKHDLPGKFQEKMNDLAALDAKHPGVVAFEQVQKQLKNVPGGDDPAAQALVEDFKKEDYRAIVSKHGHYTLLTKMPAADTTVKNYLDRLEETYTNFFYWFALKGKALTVPKYRLVAVLESNAKDFLSKHASFDAPPMAADGFTVRRDNVMVLCAKRLDDVYTLLDKNNQADWQTYKLNREVLFNGYLPRNMETTVAILQTRALVQQAMEEEAVRATATHEGTRQLLSATGLLPRNVAAGEWVRYGLASFFETPLYAYYPGVGLPSWTNLIAFKHLHKTGKLPDDHSNEVLLNTISDRYFHKAYGLQAGPTDGKENKDLSGPRSRQALEMAHATSWAFVYYLLNLDGYTEGGKDGGKSENLDRLLNYLQELSNLPRDVEYDAAVLQGCFGRAFGMLKDDPANPNGLDMQKLQSRANACFNTMEVTVLEVRGIEDEALRDRYPQPAAPAPK